MTGNEWFSIILFLGIAAYHWFNKAKSKAWFFAGLAYSLMAVLGETYTQWFRLALVLAGIFSFIQAFSLYIRSRPDHELGQAVLGGNLAKTRDLLRKGANPNTSKWVAYGPETEVKNLGTPLMVAATNGYKEIAHELLKAGARVDEKDNKGWTALILASENGHVALCKILLDSGANPNTTTNQSGTALMIAAIRGHSEVVHLLLDRGADPSITDSIGVSALDFAKKYGRADVVAILTRK